MNKGVNGLNKNALKGLKAKSALVSRPLRGSMNQVVTKATERQMWYPGASAPSYLDGSMAGDYGFDPLRLGANPNLINWYREAELMNGRWAMAAVVGILFTEAVGLPSFVEAGSLDYGIPTINLILIEVITMGVFEYARLKAYEKTGETGLLGVVPFDPLGMKSEKMKEKELKNGRLAMVAFLGFCSQYAVTGKLPLACLKEHIADPAHVNIYTSSVGLEVTLAIVFLSFAPLIIDVFKGDGEEEFRPIPW